MAAWWQEEHAWQSGPLQEEVWQEEGDEAAELKPLEGAIVEVHGCEEPVEPLGDSGAGAVDANGRRGRACFWSAARDGYIVRTFDGLLLSIPEGNLRKYEPGVPEDGGFDLTWPEHPDAYEAFAGIVYQDLLEKGYCLIQTFQTDESRSALREAARTRTDFTCLKREFEEGYLGRDAYSKVAWLSKDRPSADDDPALNECQLHLESLCSMLAPGAFEVLEFTPMDGCMGTFLRMPIESTLEEVDLDGGQVFDHDIADGKVEDYIDFIRRRKLCMMYWVDGEGGSVELEPVSGTRGPAETSGEEEAGPALRAASLPVTRGKVLVFRHDKMRYAYRPKGADLALQAWMAQEPPMLVLNNENLQGKTAGRELDGLFGINLGVPSPGGLKDNVLSAAVRFAANGEDIDMFWTWLAAGTDTFTCCPISRFNIDDYYSADVQPGRTAVKHGGFADTEMWHQFDHDYFGMSWSEADKIAPDMKVALETGFEVLHRGGFELSMLGGKPIWTYIGDSGTDWGEQDPSAFINASVSSAARLMYTLGLTGTPVCIDTACSSSLVAAALCQHGLRERRQEAGEHLMHREPRSQMGLAMGICALFGVSSYIVLSGGGFLSPEGRCFTFDNSANGYARGEGVGAIYMKGSDNACEALERLACFLGSDVNQDGRSASMTAPNGPSQQLCIKSSIRMAQLSPAEVSIAELHGTGTALGDPIEVGALRGVMSSERENQQVLLETSAKAMTGHLEACAGIAGIIKCMVMGLSSAGNPNCHLQELNPHLSVSGWPTFFLSELCETSLNTSVAGVSSFGYGGTNARADFWGRCRRGPLRTADLTMSSDRLKMHKLDYLSIPCPKCMGPMCWLCSVALPKNAAPAKHHCSAIREDFAPYDFCSDCFEGSYQHGQATNEEADPGEGVFIIGSWCAWGEYEEMTRMPTGEYVAEISIGETCKEKFHLALDAKPWLAIHPVESDAGPRSRIVGPESQEEGPHGKHWLIDGRRDGTEAGTVYRITFTWGTKRKTVAWEATDAKRPVRVENEQRQRRYSVAGSWTSWRFRNMPLDGEDPDTWKTTVKIGLSGEEEFHFARDQDPTQAIYPEEARASEPYVPVRGPDGRGNNRHWVIFGAAGEVVTLRLRVSDGCIAVSTHSKQRGERLWSNTAEREVTAYHVAGSWNGWVLGKMLADADGSPDIHRCYVTIGDDALEEFQIVANRDWNQVLHPTFPCAAPGEGLLAGPDAEGEGLHWQVFGPPGQTVEITLNLRSEDRRNAVSSRRLAWNEHPPEQPLEDEVSEERPFDIVVYGASGFLGQLMVQHLDALLSKGASRRPHTWAIAGRSMTSLSRIARSCRGRPGIIEARTPGEIGRMASKCRVVVNAAGPYIRCGEPVVRACVEQGTDYIDASSEHQWIRQMIDRHHDVALRRGVAVVCSAGHISAPYDLMCAKLVQRLGPLRRIRMYLCQYGADSGGSLSTSIANLEQLTDSSLELEYDPFSLGGRRRCGVRADDAIQIEFVEQDLLFPSLFLAPASRGRCPERIIRRSCGLFEEERSLKYGRDFQVILRETAPSEEDAQSVLKRHLPAPNSQAGRELMARQIRAQANGETAPLPGQGPPEALRAVHRTECFALAEGEDGLQGHAFHSAPGAHEASAILCIAGALVLAEERKDVLPSGRGGVMTPAVAFLETSFSERVQAHGFAHTNHWRMEFRYGDGPPTEEEVQRAVASVQHGTDVGEAKLRKGLLSTVGPGALTV